MSFSFTTLSSSGDAANKLFNKKTVDVLKEFVDNGTIPEGKATLLYLTMINQIMAPIENPNFGTPFDATESMYTGIYTMRLWREYVRLHNGLVQRFTSLESYRTAEVIVSGCVNHFLIAKLFGSDIPWERKGPTRNVADDRELEGLFGLVRAGKIGSNMSVNKTLLEFGNALALAEGSLGAKALLREQGVPIPTHAGHKETWVLKEGDSEKWKVFSELDKTFTYDEFKGELENAKVRGLAKAQKQVEDFAPTMATFFSATQEGCRIWALPMPDDLARWREKSQLKETIGTGVWRATNPAYINARNGTDLVNFGPSDLAKFGLPASPCTFADTHIDGDLVQQAEAAQATWEENRRAQGLEDFEASPEPPTLPASPPLRVEVELRGQKFAGSLLQLAAHDDADVFNGIVNLIDLADDKMPPSTDAFHRVLSSAVEARAVEMFLKKKPAQGPSWTVEDFQQGLEKAGIHVEDPNSNVKLLFERAEQLAVVGLEDIDDYDGASLSSSALPEWARASVGDFEASTGPSRRAYVLDDAVLLDRTAETSGVDGVERAWSLVTKH